MRPVELTPRLLALARQVPQGARFADVGTDHARLPVWLLEHGVITSAIATDLREGPLDHARRTAARHGLTDRISFRLGDGLAPLSPGEADVCAIAGMGGETIAAMLEAAPWAARQEGWKLLLQPMTSLPELRLFLQTHHYQITRELLCREGDSLYTVISVQPGEMPPLTYAEQWAGRADSGQDPILRGELLDLLQIRADRALEGIRRSNRPSDFGRREELEILCAQLRAMREGCASCQT